MEAGHKRIPKELEGRNFIPCQATAQHMNSGKVYQKWKPLHPSTSYVLQIGRGEVAGNRKESQQPDQFDVSTSDAHIPSSSVLTTNCFKAYSTYTVCIEIMHVIVHILQLLNIVFNLSTLGLYKSLALRSLSRREVKDDTISSTSQTRGST